MSLSSITKIGEVVATWLDPERRKVAKLRKAIGAAEELLKIWDKQGRYKDWDSKKLSKYKYHYKKQFNAWKDGV
jgi:hypothetical protein